MDGWIDGSIDPSIQQWRSLRHCIHLHVETHPALADGGGRSLSWVVAHPGEVGCLSWLSSNHVVYSIFFQPVKTTRPVSKASQAVDRTRSWISTLLHPRQSRVDRVRSRHKHGIRHWSKLREDGDEGDEDAERDRIERERRVILAKRATLDARVIVQAAEVGGRGVGVGVGVCVL